MPGRSCYERCLLLNGECSAFRWQKTHTHSLLTMSRTVDWYSWWIFEILYNCWSHRHVSADDDSFCVCLILYLVLRVRLKAQSTKHTRTHTYTRRIRTYACMFLYDCICTLNRHLSRADNLTFHAFYGVCVFVRVFCCCSCEHQYVCVFIYIYLYKFFVHICLRYLPNILEHILKVYVQSDLFII